MSWIVPLSAADDPSLVGAKAHGLYVLHHLGLPVPPGFAVAITLHRAGRFPPSFDAELTTALQALETTTGPGPLRVSVRSGAPVSMPGMMATVLDVGASEVRDAIEQVLASWDSPRATTYRRLHDIDDDLGTAVVVQAMVYGDRDEHSASGVAFSRDPMTGDPAPYGEVVFRAHGVDVVDGTHPTRPLTDLATRIPDAWHALRTALTTTERHYRDVCHLEFTIESGNLWLLQVRPGGIAPSAAARIAVDLVHDGILTREEAVARVDLAHHTPQLPAGVPVLTRGTPASPGLASGRTALTADDAVRLAAHGPVILVRPTTSPADLHGLAAAAGVITFRGGPTSHAAVVARSMNKPAVVGAEEVTLSDGTEVTIDGTTGIVTPGIHSGVTSSDDPAMKLLRQWSTYGLAEN
ncbi:PEP/pyruvate-binding domain-containing protein [Cryptosporangium sp. NPDC048952]|uniref:PEP/pyruvate-binding domain-containing protein n=1 Tax=Cryptosporangium sp. NPDC048952 TaxID=3363961 RepID=UPI0037213511